MKNTLVIDLDRCSGCDSCVAACKMENQMNLGVVRNHVSAVGPVGTFPDIEMYWLPMQCQQCENPGCIEVCPTGASYRDEETGIVLVNAEDCIGCESCLTGCPYGVRQLNPKTNTIEKCTLCFQRKNDENWVPACVHNCCCGARTFGDLDDPNSEAAKVVAAAGENAHYLFDPADLHPTTVYILSEKTAKWQEEPVEVTRYEKKSPVCVRGALAPARRCAPRFSVAPTVAPSLLAVGRSCGFAVRTRRTGAAALVRRFFEVAVPVLRSALALRGLCPTRTGESERRGDTW